MCLITINASPSDDMVHSEDIEKMAQAVLNIQLPPAQMRSMISDIKNLMTNSTKAQDDLEDQTKTSQDLQQKAQEVE